MIMVWQGLILLRIIFIGLEKKKIFCDSRVVDIDFVKNTDLDSFEKSEYDISRTNLTKRIKSSTLITPNELMLYVIENLDSKKISKQINF